MIEPSEARIGVGELEGPGKRPEWNYWGLHGSQRAAGIRVQVLIGPGEAWEDLAVFLGSSGACWVLVESAKAKWSPEGCGKTWWGLVGSEGQPS